MKIVDGKMVPDDFAVSDSLKKDGLPPDETVGLQRDPVAATMKQGDAGKTEAITQAVKAAGGAIPHPSDPLVPRKSNEPVSVANSNKHVGDERFKPHPAGQVAKAQATHVTALKEAQLKEAGNNDDNKTTGAEKLKLIETALKNKGLDSMQLINAMVEIKAILNW